MGYLAVQLDATRRREYRRFMLVSALGHALLMAFFVASPEIRMATPAGVIAVDLVAMPAPAAPAPKAAAPRPPAPPVPKKVVLPAEPTPAKPKPKAEPKPKPPEKKPAPPVEKPPERVEQEYTDVLAQLRAEVGDETPRAEPDAPAAATGVAGIAGAVGIPVSPEVAAWLRKAKIHVRRSWVVPPGFRTQALETHVVVRLDAVGNVIGDPEILRRSGNPWYDDGVVRAIQKASPLPPPPEADRWTFVFLPEDSL